MKKNFILLISLLLFVGQVNSQTSLFVDDAATDDSGAGTSWETAKKSIAGALTAASGSTTIYLKAGNYTTTAEFVVPSGVTIIGAFDNSSTGTDISQRLYPGENANWTNSTLCAIICGNFSHRIATVNSGGTLEGCVIRMGKTTDKGGGVMVNGGTLRYCVVKENDAINTDNMSAKGGGVYVQNNGVVINCVVCFNRGDQGPGIAGTDGTLTNNTITQNLASHCGYVTDYEGNIYNTVVIGTQCWTRQNIRSRYYSDGTPLPANGYNLPSNWTPSDLITKGYKYTWSTTMNNATPSNTNPSGVQGICPLGWHVPSSLECEQLIAYVAHQPSFIQYSGRTAEALAYTSGWYSGHALSINPERNNITGFSAQQIIVVREYYNTYDYNNFGYAYFWVSSQNGYCMYIKSSGSASTASSGSEAYNSVRCVKD